MKLLCADCADITLLHHLFRSDNVEEYIGVLWTLPPAEGEGHPVAIRFELPDFHLH